VLVECHADVTTRGSAEEALAWLEHERPDVIVSDIGMPGVDGFGLLKRAQAHWANDGGPVPAIALTAFARAEDRARVLEAGFAAHLAKPIQPADLIEAVARVADRAR
jgi:CheY-like chemotaxis protein